MGEKRMKISDQGSFHKTVMLGDLWDPRICGIHDRVLWELPYPCEGGQRFHDNLGEYPWIYLFVNNDIRD
jgi:hypothetical protein